MRSISLVSATRTPCGVEAFARGLAAHLAAAEPGAHAVVRLPDSLSALLAFGRLDKALDAVHSSLKLVAFSSLYPLSNGMLAKIRNIRFEYYDKARPPASTMVLFEGLPSMDASFGIDVIAVPRE